MLCMPAQGLYEDKNNSVLLVSGDTVPCTMPGPMLKQHLLESVNEPVRCSICLTIFLILDSITEFILLKHVWSGFCGKENNVSPTGFLFLSGNRELFFFGSINRQIQTSDTIKQNSVVSNRVQVVSHFNNWRMLTIHLVVIFNTSEEIIGLTES